MHLFRLFYLICFFGLIATNCQNTQQAEDSETSTSVSTEKAPSKDYASLEARGLAYIRMAGDTLKASLMKAVQERGAADAIGFCNVHAYDIIHSIESEGVEISRVSEKNRNPLNGATGNDLEALVSFKKALENGEPMATSKYVKVLEDQQQLLLYKPIMVDALCLNCHGKPNVQIQPPVLAMIDSLYPEDKARAYEMGDLRGSWKVRIPLN